MAVLAEAISVIVKVEAIQKIFPGGWDAFAKSVGNSTLCADNELARVGFMSPNDAREFIDKLEAQGLKHLNDGQSIDLTVTDQQRGLTGNCDWLEFGRISWQGDDDKLVPAARLSSSLSTVLITPEGWKYEDSLSHKFTFVEAGHIPEHLDYLRTENGLDIYRDIKTGKEVFIPAQREP